MTGSGLSTATACTVAGVAAVTQSVTDTRIQLIAAAAPAAVAGAVSCRLGDDVIVTSPQSFVYFDASATPTILGVTPAVIPLAGMHAI